MIYTATFRTEDTWATEDIDAETPEEALQKARALVENDDSALDWCSYDAGCFPLDEIEIVGPNGEEAFWRSEDLAVRLASLSLFNALEAQTDAAQAVIDAWESGDLAAVVRTLAASIGEARNAIAAAKGNAA